MKQKMSTEEYIHKAKGVHGDKYLYTNTVYKGVSEKVEVECAIHGSFWVRPHNHVSRKSGCPECAKQSYGKDKKELAKSTFVTECSKIHNNRYDYSRVKYITSHTKVQIICSEHGTFEMMPYCHRQGQGCPKCGIDARRQKQTLTTEEFIERAKDKHNNKYDYSYVNYYRATEKVQIICPEHGPFLQRPGQHLRGEGCPDCARERSVFDGYSYEYFNRYPHEKQTPAILYLIEFSNNDERFYKIGITKNSVKERYHWGYSQYELVVHMEQPMPLYEAFIREQEILNQLRKQRYVPQIKIGGWTECLSKHLSVVEIKLLAEGCSF